MTAFMAVFLLSAVPEPPCHEHAAPGRWNSEVARLQASNRPSLSTSVISCSQNPFFWL